MKTLVISFFAPLASLAGAGAASAQGSGFSYQGRLNLNGRPDTGTPVQDYLDFIAIGPP